MLLSLSALNTSSVPSVFPRRRVAQTRETMFPSGRAAARAAASLSRRGARPASDAARPRRLDASARAVAASAHALAHAPPRVDLVPTMSWAFALGVPLAAAPGRRIRRRPPLASARSPRGFLGAFPVSASAATGTGNSPATVKFEDLGLCAPSLRALREVKGFERATAVQDQTLPHVLGGADVLARAKTGSGKTIAFLLPALEKLFADRARDGASISVLVLSPTRELATQIHEEAKQLLTFHGAGVGAQVVYGGTKIDKDIKSLRANRCDVLVATPGRLIDHLENGDLARRLEGCHTLVLDEADRLLDMGFKRDVDRILGYVPANRQTLLFSATVSAEIEAVASRSLRPGYRYVDCVGEEDTGATNLQVKQSLAIVPLESTMASVKRLIESHEATTPNHKVMVFFPTARSTALAAELFARVRADVVEIHSKLSQPRRTRATEAFREAKRAVMMTSDVTARGIDFPDVTLVIQVGLPSNREQYIHRLGRTARAGKSGEGVLVLTEREAFFAEQDIGDLPLEKGHPGAVATEEDRVAVDAAMRAVSPKTKAQCYSAWLGFYKGFAKKMRLTPEALVAEANFLAVNVMGCDEPPGLLKKTIGMMGLKGVTGLNIVSALPEYDAGGGGGRGGGRARGGGGGGGGGGGRGAARGARGGGNAGRLRRGPRGGEGTRAKTAAAAAAAARGYASEAGRGYAREDRGGGGARGYGDFEAGPRPGRGGGRGAARRARARAREVGDARRGGVARGTRG